MADEKRTSIVSKFLAKNGTHSTQLIFLNHLMALMSQHLKQFLQCSALAADGLKISVVITVISDVTRLIVYTGCSSIYAQI